MDVSAVFLPVGVELIDNTFPTDILYRRHRVGTYDPLSGQIVYPLIGVPVTGADYANASAVCVSTASGDYQVSDADDGVVSLCADPMLPAGVADYDNADIQPRTDIDDVTKAWTEYAIKAGVLNRGKVETDGTSETHEINLWVHHAATGLTFLPSTADSLLYDSVVWKVVAVEPTFSSKSLIASKIKARAA